MRSFLAIPFALTCLVSSALATNFVVTNTNSSGPGSLSQAITDANAVPGRDNITFNIPGAGVHVIDASTALPEITDSVIIDGYTQPGAQPNTQTVGDNAVILIEINSQSSGTNGLLISAGTSIVRGLSITGFNGFGIELKDPGTGNTIEGNFIGLRPDGTTVLTGDRGINIVTADNVIGGTTPAARNVISGVPDPASLGVFVAGNQNTVCGNYIGTDASGMVPHSPNVGVIMFPGFHGNVIGGTASGTGNVISGTFAAVHVNSSPSQIQGNYLGIASDGKTPFGNNGIGVYANGSNNTIGGLAPGAGNVIAFSGVAGVFVWPANQINNAILSNSIFGWGPGIKLGDDGPHANDNLDTDDGPNHLQNFPVITSTGFSGNTWVINANLNSTPNTQFTVQFFTDSADYLHLGQTFLKTMTVITDNNGNAAIVAGFSASSLHGPIDMTATDPAGNTSEFFLRPSKARNLSARARVEPGDNALIGGIIVDGSFSQTASKIIVRALGPSLSVNGSPVAGRLDDPVLQLYGDPPFAISNDNWGDDPNTAAELQKYGLTPSSERESAIVFNPGAGRNFTAVVRGKNNSSGIAVVEFYDVIGGTTRRLANISARGLVRGGDNVMIGGFIAADGFGPTPFVVRALGPSLSKFGIANPLPDPLLELYNENGTLLWISDNWQESQVQEDYLTAAGLAPSDPKEAALLVVLRPGAYTAIVRGSDGGTGVALVEVYQLPYAGIGDPTYSFTSQP
jgi:hypothetical protein